jgi:hypothetical protein
MKKAIALLCMAIGLFSCQELVKKLTKNESFNGSQVYKTNRKDFKVELGERLNLPNEQISDYWGTDSKNDRTVYRLGITINETPKSLFNDSLSKVVSNHIYDVITEEVVNLKEYDKVVITLRDENTTNGITKRQEYIIEKTIQ